MQLFLTVLCIEYNHHETIHVKHASMLRKNVDEMVDDWYSILCSNNFSKRQVNLSKKWKCSIGKGFWFRFIFQMAIRIFAKLDQYNKDRCEGIGNYATVFKIQFSNFFNWKKVQLRINYSVFYYPYWL